MSELTWVVTHLATALLQGIVLGFVSILLAVR